MSTVAMRAPIVERRVEVAFVGEKAVEDDILMVAAILGIELPQLGVHQFEHTSGLLDGAKVLASAGIKIDLVVYVADHWMSHQNSTVLREHAGADGILFLWRGVSSIAVSVINCVAIVQIPRDMTLEQLSTLFAATAYLGGWPKSLAAQR